MGMQGKSALLAVTALALLAAVLVIVAVERTNQSSTVELKQTLPPVSKKAKPGPGKQNDAQKNVVGQQQQLREQLRRIIKAIAPHNQKLQAAFPGEPKDELKVCEPWPSCCDWGKKTLTCYGVITEGVLAPHTCSPYPFCCGHSWDNCFDATGGKRGLPQSSDDAPSPVEVQELIEECEGEEQLAQCLLQTQGCLSVETAPSSSSSSSSSQFTIRHPWRETDACTCFKSSVYCSWPQNYQTCSPCPLSCQKRLFALLNSARKDMSKEELSCALLEAGGGEAGSMYDDEWREKDEEDTGIDMSDPHSWGVDDRLGGEGWDDMDVDSYGGAGKGSDDNVGGEYYPPGGMYGHVFPARGRARYT